MTGRNLAGSSAYLRSLRPMTSAGAQPLWARHQAIWLSPIHEDFKVLPEPLQPYCRNVACAASGRELAFRQSRRPLHTAIWRPARVPTCRPISISLANRGGARGRTYRSARAWRPRGVGPSRQPYPGQLRLGTKIELVRENKPCTIESRSGRGRRCRSLCSWDADFFGSIPGQDVVGDAPVTGISISPTAAGIGSWRPTARCTTMATPLRWVCSATSGFRRH